MLRHVLRKLYKLKEIPIEIMEYLTFLFVPYTDRRRLITEEHIHTYIHGYKRKRRTLRQSATSNRYRPIAQSMTARRAVDFREVGGARHSGIDPITSTNHDPLVPSPYSGGILRRNVLRRGDLSGGTYSGGVI